MQAEVRSGPHGRVNSIHPKRGVLGNPAKQVPPSWKTNGPSGGAGLAGANSKGKVQEQGSKIFLSRLPADVSQTEVEDLFRKTVGPVKEAFIVYNSQGLSKGMAVVAFQRPGDAIAARAKYDGKIVDGRRPIKIEIIVDAAPSRSEPQSPVSLLSRLAPAQPSSSSFVSIVDRVGPVHVTSIPTPTPIRLVPTPVRPASTPVRPAPIPHSRFRQKKGPKRLKKVTGRNHVTAADLDREMDEYRAAADLEAL